MSQIAKWTLLVQVGSTLAMVGLIWFVQVVHYPLFSQVGRDQFRRYEMDHQRLTMWVVAPLMLLEMISALVLIWWRPPGIGTPSVYLGVFLTVSIWLMTYAIQVPQHASLLLSYNAVIHQRLVRDNWYRTVAWSSRGLLVLWMVSQTLATIPVSQLDERAGLGLG